MREFGEPVYDRVEVPATPEQKQSWRSSRHGRSHPQSRRRKIESILTEAPGNGAPIGGLKVTAGNDGLVARPSGTEDIYKVYAESFRGPDHLPHPAEAQAIVGSWRRQMQQLETASKAICRTGDERANAGQSPERNSLLSTDVEGFDLVGRAGPGYAFVVETNARPGWRQLIRCQSSRTTLGPFYRRLRKNFSVI